MAEIAPRGDRCQQPGAGVLLKDPTRHRGALTQTELRKFLFSSLSSRSLSPDRRAITHSVTWKLSKNVEISWSDVEKGSPRTRRTEV